MDTKHKIPPTTNNQPAPTFKPALGATPEEMEEMASRKHWTVGRNQGLAAQASKADADSSKDS